MRIIIGPDQIRSGQWLKRIVTLKCTSLTCTHGSSEVTAEHILKGKRERERGRERKGEREGKEYMRRTSSKGYSPYCNEDYSYEDVSFTVTVRMTHSREAPYTHTVHTLPHKAREQL